MKLIVNLPANLYKSIKGGTHNQDLLLKAWGAIKNGIVLNDGVYSVIVDNENVLIIDKKQKR